MDFSFWDIFWPVFAGGVATFFFSQILMFSVGYWWQLRQQKFMDAQMKEMMESGNFDPNAFAEMGGMDGMPMMVADPSMMGQFNPTTVSGGPKVEDVGQYL